MGEKIILRTPNWVGDAVISTSLLPLIKKHFSSASLYLQVHPRVKDIFLNNPYVDGLLILGKERIRERFDLGILFTNSFSSALIFFLSGVKKRVGYATDGRRVLLTHSVPLPPNWKTMPQVDFYLGILRFLGMEGEKAGYQLYLTSEEIKRTREIFKLKKPFVVLFPGAAYGSAKRWPVERFAELAYRLHKKYGFQPYVLGSRRECFLGEIIENIYPSVINLMGKTSLREAMAITAQANLAVTNDSGAFHIAIALNVPVVAIFGPTPVEKTRPFHGKFSVVKKEVKCSPCKYRVCPFLHECMMEVMVDDVERAIGKLLEGKNA